MLDECDQPALIAGFVTDEPFEQPRQPPAFLEFSCEIHRSPRPTMSRPRPPPLRGLGQNSHIYYQVLLFYVNIQSAQNSSFRKDFDFHLAPSVPMTMLEFVDGRA